MTFFLFLQDVKIAQGFGFSFFFRFFFFFFKGISGVNSGIIIISDVREEVFFFLFRRTTTTSSLVIFLKNITKAKLLQGLSLTCFFLNLNLNLNVDLNLNLNLKLRKAPLADMGTLGISSIYLGLRIYI